MSDLLGDVDRGAIVYFDGWIHENDSTLREVRKESDSPQGFSKILRRRIKEEEVYHSIAIDASGVLIRKVSVSKKNSSWLVDFFSL